VKISLNPPEPLKLVRILDSCVCGHKLSISVRFRLDRKILSWNRQAVTCIRSSSKSGPVVHCKPLNISVLLRAPSPPSAHASSPTITNAWLERAVVIFARWAQVPLARATDIAWSTGQLRASSVPPQTSKSMSDLKHQEAWRGIVELSSILEIFAVFPIAQTSNELSKIHGRLSCLCSYSCLSSVSRFS
jgi:hypothetical protein